MFIYRTQSYTTAEQVNMKYMKLNNKDIYETYFINH